MADFLNQQLTNVGWNALSTALGGGRLTFFKMQAGSGSIGDDSAIPPMTALVNPVCDIPISSYVIEGNGQITLIGSIASKNLDVGFTFRELGVFATIEAPVKGQGGTLGQGVTAIVSAPGQQANPVVPNPPYGTAVMYSYCNSYANSDYIPGKGETTDVVNTIQVTVKIDKAANVQIIITAGQQLSVVNIGDPSIGAGPWSNTTANVAYLKRLVAGPQLSISEDANTITIGQRQLSVSSTLNVAPGNPDVAPNFSTLQKAMGYLSQYLFAPGINITIKIWPGAPIYSNTQQITLDHVNGNQIIIQGVNSAGNVDPDQSFSGISSITGSSGNWSVTYTGIANTSAFKVNGYLSCYNAGGSSGLACSLVTGMFKVTAVTASTVTVMIPYRRTAWPSVSGCGGQITPINVLFTITTQSTHCILIWIKGIGQFNNIGIVNTIAQRNDYSCTGLLVYGQSAFNKVGVCGFLNNQSTMVGIQVAGVSCTFKNCTSSNNSTGIVAAAYGQDNFIYCGFSHNGSMGIWAQGGTILSMQGVTHVAGNGYTLNFCAVYVAAKSTMVNQGYQAGSYQTGNWYIGYNNYWGILMAAQSTQIASSSNDQVVAQFNGQSGVAGTDADLSVNGLSYATGSTFAGSRKFNIPVNTLSADGSYIAN